MPGCHPRALPGPVQRRHLAGVGACLRRLRARRGHTRVPFRRRRAAARAWRRPCRHRLRLRRHQALARPEHEQLRRHAPHGAAVRGALARVRAARHGRHLRASVHHVRHRHAQGGRQRRGRRHRRQPLRGGGRAHDERNGRRPDGAGVARPEPHAARLQRRRPLAARSLLRRHAGEARGDRRAAHPRQRPARRLGARRGAGLVGPAPALREAAVGDALRPRHRLRQGWPPGGAGDRRGVVHPAQLLRPHLGGAVPARARRLPADVHGRGQGEQEAPAAARGGDLQEPRARRHARARGAGRRGGVLQRLRRAGVRGLRRRLRPQPQGLRLRGTSRRVGHSGERDVPRPAHGVRAAPQPAGHRGAADAQPARAAQRVRPGLQHRRLLAPARRGEEARLRRPRQVLRRCAHLLATC